MLLLILFSFLSGFVTVLSPCVLPVLPIVLSSSASHGKRRPLGVIIGLIISFSIFTLAISQIVQLLGLSANTLRIAAVAVIGFLGFSMLIPKLNELIEKALSFIPNLAGNSHKEGNGFTPGFITGLSLGLVWAPCAGPILASVTALAATQEVTLGAVLVVTSYALGSGIPLLAIAYGGRSIIQKVPFLSKNLGRVQKGFGVVMILTSILIALNLDVLVTVWLTDRLPSLTNAINKLESSDAVSQEIGKISGGDSPSYFISDEVTEDNLRSGEILPNLGPAPDLVGISNWINSKSISLEDLKGKVVIIDFWTYSCVNCVRTLPYLTDWHAKYAEDGLVIIGVHAPEFIFEKDVKNVMNAVERFGIKYPVAQDNDFLTWRAYNNRYWPAKYFIDAQGNIRYTHFGEGEYEKSELVIQQLLDEAGVDASDQLSAVKEPDYISGQTPELYIGYQRQKNFFTLVPLARDQTNEYFFSDNIDLHSFTVSGKWTFADEFARVEEAGAQLKLHFFAKDVFLVLDSEEPVSLKVELLSTQETNTSPDLDFDNEILIDSARLYHLVQLEQAVEGQLLLTFNQPGIQAYAFTFGS